MTETAEPSLTVLRLRGNDFFVGLFLRKYPEVAAAIRAAGAYVVVFAPDYDLEAIEHSRIPTAESVTRRTRLALEEAERAVSARPGVPLFVACDSGCYFYRALLGEDAPLVGLTAQRGPFVGFVECGEGGATFYAPDGRHGAWELARDVVMALVSRSGGARGV